MTYRIQRPFHGKHHNSPVVWRDVGQIESDTPEQAAIRALMIVGSAQIRVMPVRQEPWQRSGDEWKQAK